MAIVYDEEVSFPVGTTSVGPVNLNPNTVNLEIRLARYTTLTPQYWPSENVSIDLLIEISLDGGDTWDGGAAGYLTHGGLRYEKGGSDVELAENITRTTIQSGPQRRLRARAIVTGGVLDSRLIIDIS
jgi:hypothetical protein